MSRDVILARRARFIAAALAAVGAGACSGEANPKPCLDIDPTDGAPFAHAPADGSPDPDGAGGDAGAIDSATD